MVIGADQSGDFAREWKLRVVPRLEADRERLQWVVDQTARDRRDRARVEAAAQEDAERHVAHQPQLDRFLEEVRERRGLARAPVSDPRARSAAPSTASR